MYEVGVGYSEWRGGDYNGSYIGAYKTYHFKSLENATKFSKDVNNKVELSHLKNASASPPRKTETRD